MEVLDDPVPAGEARDPLRIGIEFGQDRLDGRHLVGNSWIDRTLDPGPQMLEDALDTLAHLYPTSSSHTSGGPDQPDSHLVRPAHTSFSDDAGRRQGDSTPPFFQASWSSRVALVCRGRGILGAQRNRASKMYIPTSL